MFNWIVKDKEQCYKKIKWYENKWLIVIELFVSNINQWNNSTEGTKKSSLLFKNVM